MRFKLGLIAVAVVAVQACSSDGDERRQEYLNADYYTRLELPPDLSQPSTSQQLSLPRPTDAAMEKFRADTAHLGEAGANGEVISAASILPTLNGVELKSDNGQFWLEVSANTQQLWPRLIAFWAHEAVPVVASRPLLGSIETDWVSQFQEKPDAGWLTKMFNKIEPERLDKFRMRVQADSNASKSRVYVSHSGMEQVQHEVNDYLSWRARCSEAGLEQDILSRLALYLGLDEQRAKVALANYKPYASRVSSARKDDGSDSTELATVAADVYLNLSMDEAWTRTRLALDRIGADIQAENRSQAEYLVSMARLERPLATDEERDEIAESSWLMQWFSSFGEDDAPSQFKIALAEEKNQVKLSILDTSDEPASGDQADQFRGRLIQELQ